jgi:hypothetical protein
MILLAALVCVSFTGCYVAAYEPGYYSHRPVAYRSYYGPGPVVYPRYYTSRSYVYPSSSIRY